ncbi:MAG TPA: MFS transporter [Anaerolineales bacterium]|jgi:FSR family fosmidomycin resistance protein-like MFS transporter|nr:MFS transporter [Anaerolineales bacterium]
MAILTNTILLSVLIGHLSVDVLNGQRSVLFTFLSVPLGLSISQLGIFSTAYMVAAALIQPVFGYVADRIGSRWVMAGGILWMGLFYSAGLMVPGISGLVLLVVAGLGSGVFHPAGTMQATLIGRTVFKGRETTSASYFFFFGQLGLFAGPLLSGLILQNSGIKGLLWVSALMFPAAVFAAFSGRTPRKHNPGPVQEAAPAGDRPVRLLSWSLGAMALLAAFQSWTQQNMVTYLPKHLELIGKTPAEYGFLAALFMGGSAVGNVVGGNLADTFGKRKVASIALGLASIPITLIALLGWSEWLYLLVPLAGAFSGSTHSIIVVLAQRLIPSGMGLASGLILGFMFSAGALGAMLSGYFAELWGFPIMFGFTAGLVLAASILTRSLPKT